jgi:uncharacterized protein (UPF0332 family)
MTADTHHAISMMLKKAKEKLKTAEIEYDTERYDDSVSRAYYAVFHAISAVLLSKGLHYSSHSQTIGAFNKEFVKPGVFPKEFTRNIQKLFNDRQTGDYDFENSFEKDAANDDISAAREIINACEQYLHKVMSLPTEKDTENSGSL